VVLNTGKIAGDECKKIRRLGMRVVPDREVATVGSFSVLDQIAI
jgi:hypothetical protein